MLKNNAPCFIATPPVTDEQRTLVSATVQQTQGESATIQTSDAIEIRPGSELVVFAEFSGKLHQQPAKVTTVDSPAARTIGIKLVGEPVNCDFRGSYRVSVASGNIPVVVGKQPNCTVADISPEGVAVITSSPLTVGQTVDIDLSIESIYARGTLHVVAEKKLEGGKFRYGLRAGAEKKSGIRKSLEALTNLLHRRQIQRLARAA